MDSILKSFSWVMAGKLSKNVVTFLITVFLARLLSPSDFGLIAIVTGFTAIANILVDLGLSSAIIQRDDDDVDSDLLSSVFWLNLLIAILFGLLVYYTAGFFSNYYQNIQLEMLIKIASVVFVVNGLSTLHTALLKKKGKFKEISLYRLYSSIISGFFAISLAYFGFGVYSLVFGILLDSLIFTILLWVYNTYIPKFYISLKKIKSIFGFSSKIFFSRIFEELITQLDYFVLGKVANIKVLGFFQRGKSLSTLVGRYSSESILYVMFPVLSNIKNDRKDFKNLCFKTFSIINFGCFLIAILLYNSAYEIINLIYGQKWLNTVPYFSILMIYSIVFPINRILTTFLKSMGLGSIYLKTFMLQKIEVVLCIIILIFTKSIDIYLYSLVIFGYSTVIFSIFFVTRILSFNTKEYLTEFAKTLLSSISIILIVSSCRVFFITGNDMIILSQNLILTFILFLLFSLLLNFKSKIFLLSMLKSKILNIE